MINYKQIIQNIYSNLKDIEDNGKVADYIPELGNVSATNFGVNLRTIKKESFGVGNYEEKFSIQSISKILALTLAYKLEGEKIW